CERVSSSEFELGRTSGTTGAVGTGASCCQLCADLLAEVAAAREREPDRCQLMKLHPCVLARSGGVCEQPLDAVAPVAAVEGDSAGRSFDRVPPACFVADARGELQRALYAALRIGHATALEQDRPEPVAGVECQPRQDATASLVPYPLSSFERLVQAAH